MGKKRSNSSDEDDVDVDVDTDIKETDKINAIDDAEVAVDDSSKPKRKRQRKRKKKSSSSKEEGADDASSSSVTDATKKSEDIISTVYVEGLPFDATNDEIRDFFETGGIPESEIIEMRLPKWQDSGRLRGYGHVAFTSAEAAAKALEMNGKYLKKRYLSIQKPNLPKVLQQREHRDQPDGCKTIFIKNLPYDCTEAEILEALETCGKILDGGVRIAQNHATRQLKGFGYVEFKNAEGAAAAVELAKKPFGLCVKGRPLFVDYEEDNRAKGSFRTTDGQLWHKKYGNKR